MPIYEFACPVCRKLFSFYSRRINTETIPNCPKCGAPLVKQLSLFQAKRGKGAASSPWNFDDGCEDETASAPDFDASDERIAGAISELGSQIDRMDPDDPGGTAKTLEEFAKKSGVKFNKEVTDALSKMASGDNSESVQSQLEAAMSSGNPFADGGKEAVTEVERPYEKDETLYEMP